MSATRFNVGAGNREFTAVALHNDAYRAVIKAFDDSVERINFEKRYFMSRFKQHLESYKRRFVALHENQRDPEYLNNLQQLCKEIQLAFNQQKKFASGLYVLAAAVAVLAILTAVLITFLVFPAVVCPSVACGAMMGSTLAVIFAGAVGEFAIVKVACVKDDKARFLNRISDKLSLFYSQTKENSSVPAVRAFRQ